MDIKQRKIQEQQVLQAELKTLHKGAAVYKQQQNSQVFFKTSTDKMMADSKKTLDSLVEEYKAVEATTPATGDSQLRDDG